MTNPCERCDKPSPMITEGEFAGSREMHNYCDLCSQNLCDQCMASGHCDESTTFNHRATQSGGIRMIGTDAKIPDGYAVVASGPLLKGDLVYSPQDISWVPVKNDGYVVVEQCYGVVRKTPPRSFRATWEIPADQDISDLAEFHISRGRGDDDQDVGYFPSDVDARLTIHRGESTWFVELTVPTRGLEKESDYWTSANQAFGQYDAEVELI